ncbi:precorrin-3B C(17)-methyltransferase [Streptomyces sp. ME08-AFT2]|uniref:precorrin-3B C(17)-methyltransferase n=1 Tax=Streptomyces sp. ME08-AFT2 TaxID=3028683 RepID=UPI0029BE6841|nr:precorrin-3B C(17)-methyltransferase [Streptomyces sp. ME08-AFT2]MDX3314349.1 precorrin-3B C(17)-methyltransferase [Streptomyces sp. ME08-AFT2]
MTRTRAQAQTQMRRRVGAPVLLALLFLTAGCANPSDDPRAAGSAPAPASRSPKGFCPPPEDTQAVPSPCISADWDQRVAENHAYRQEQPITAEQKREARPRATALAAVLQRLADSGTTADALRTAAATAIGLAPDGIEIQGEVLKPLHNVLVGGGEGRVCVNGAVDDRGHATAEVVGRTLDGACLPGRGGH